MGRKYDIVEQSQGLYKLYEYGTLISSFSRSTFRSSLEARGLSSNAIAPILRLFNQKFPVPHHPSNESPLSRALSTLGEHGLAEYLRAKGIRGFRPLPVSDKDVIALLEKRGWQFEGIVDGVYYSTTENLSTGKGTGPEPARHGVASVRVGLLSTGDVITELCAIDWQGALKKKQEHHPPDSEVSLSGDDSVTAGHSVAKERTA